MLRSLFFRLLGAFVLVILVLAVVATAPRQSGHGRPVPRLYRSQRPALGPAPGSDSGRLLRTNRQLAGRGDRAAIDRRRHGHDGRPMGSMMDGGMGMKSAGQLGTGAAQQSWSMWDMMGQRLLLADARGSVIADSQGELVGQTLPAQIWPQGNRSSSTGSQVGTVIVAAGVTAPASPAGEFLSSVNRSIFLAVLAAGSHRPGLGGTALLPDHGARPLI